MEEMVLYKKGKDPDLDQDFKSKRKFGEVYYCHQALYTRKGLKWYYYPLDPIISIEIVFGTRQLRQCCGAPIYKTKDLILTTAKNEHLYIKAEECEHGDTKQAELLIKEILKNYDLKVIESC